MDIVDPMLTIQSRFLESTLRKALEVAFMCLREKANARPTISEVVIALNYIVKCTTSKQKKTSVGCGRARGDLEKKATGTSSPKETSRILNVNKEEEEENEDLERERAVAEAKSWAENWREMRRKSTEPPSPDPDKC